MDPGLIPQVLTPPGLNNLIALKRRCCSISTGWWRLSFFVIVFSSFVFCSLRVKDERALLEVVAKGCGDTEVRCMLTAKEIISEWLEINNIYTTLVAGKTGAGKTRLIRGLTNNFSSLNESESLLPQTLKVKPYRYSYNGSKIILYDSPGLVDTEDNVGGRGGKNYEYLTDMVKNNMNPDVIVFCIRMDQSIENALDQEDEYVIRNISHAFGWAKWRYAMFVLTYANKVENIDAEERGDEDDLNYFEQRVIDMKLHVRRLLKDLFANKDVVKTIPIIPAGLVHEEKLVGASEDSSWVKKFWTELLKLMVKSRNERKTPFDYGTEDISI